MRTWHDFYVAMFGIFGVLSFVVALTLYSEVKYWKNQFFDTFDDCTYWQDQYHDLVSEVESSWLDMKEDDIWID